MTDEEIIQAIGTKVMGWHWVRMYAEDVYPDDSRMCWENQANDVAAEQDWNPLKDADACKQVRDNLSGKGYGWSIVRNPNSQSVRCIAWKVGQVGDPSGFAEAETEERAVAICALKTVGIEVSE